MTFKEGNSKHQKDLFDLMGLGINKPKEKVKYSDLFN